MGNMLFDEMHFSTRLDLIAVISFVLFSCGGSQPKANSPIQATLDRTLRTGIALPPSQEAKAFNSSFALGSVFF